LTKQSIDLKLGGHLDIAIILFLVNLAAQRPTYSSTNVNDSYKGCDQNIGKKISSTVASMYTDMKRKTFNNLENTEAYY